MTDQELLAAYVHSRDVDSLGVFVSRHEDGLLRYASRMLSDDMTAQDVVQETFLRVAPHPRRLLKVESCHNWRIFQENLPGVLDVLVEDAKLQVEFNQETVSRAEVSHLRFRVIGDWEISDVFL